LESRNEGPVLYSLWGPLLQGGADQLAAPCRLRDSAFDIRERLLRGAAVMPNARSTGVRDKSYSDIEVLSGDKTLTQK